MHPKTFEFASELGIRHVSAIGHLELLFHFCAQYTPEGNIGKYSDKRIAAALEWPGKPEKLIFALVKTGWVDTDDRVRLVVHDWHEHADRTTLQRLARRGKIPIKRNQQDAAKVCTQSETCIRPLPEPIPEPEPEPIPEPQSAQVVLDDLFPRFRSLAEQAGMSGSEPDWADARSFAWSRLDLFGKEAAIQGIIDRIEAGALDDPALRSLPKNYLSGRKWERKIQSPSSQPQKSVITKTLLEERLKEEHEKRKGIQLA